MLMTLFLNILFNEVVADINVALDKTVSYCGKEIKHEWLTDGIRLITNAEAIIMHCVKMSYIEIDLEKNFYIHYVIVYEGKFEKSGVLDYFKVLVGEELCGNYPKKSIGPMDNVGMRVNCNVKKNSKSVKIESLLRFGFSISEVEAYTIGSDFGGNAVSIYIGCFQSFTNTQHAELDNILNCIEMCRDNLDLFAAVKNTTCLCGKLIQEIDRISLVDCNKKCGDKICGGVNVFSVYLANIELPRYESCYSGAITVNIFGEMSISKCMDECSTTEYSALSRREDCSCIQNLNNLVVVNDSLCNLPCSNNPVEVCGGINHLSVYKGQYARFLFKCKSEMDQYGVCRGGCQTHYIGDYCIESQLEKPKTSEIIRQIITAYTNKASVIWCVSYDPCADISNSECIIIDSSYRCECKEGFTISSGICQDIDECGFIPCNLKTSTCLNMEGAYRCDCLESFKQITKFVCINNKTHSHEPFWSNFYKFYLFFIPMVILFLLVILLVIIRKTKNTKSISSSSSVM